MKKSILVFGCLFLSGCGIECSTQVMPATPYKYERKRCQDIDTFTKLDIIDFTGLLRRREDCPVPSPKTPPVKVYFEQDIDTDEESSFADGFVRACPVPSLKTPPVKK